MNRINVSRWRAFLKESPPWRMCTTWDVATIHTVFHIHDTHIPVIFTRVMPFIPQKSHYTSLLFTRWRRKHSRHLCCVVHNSLARAANEKHSPCRENLKLYLDEISTSQAQYKRRKILLCALLSDQHYLLNCIFQDFVEHICMHISRFYRWYLHAYFKIYRAYLHAYFKIL